MNNLVKRLKNLDTYRYIISVIVILEAIYRTIEFTNAPSNMVQAEMFRPLCYNIGILVLVNMDIKTWLNLWSLIYIPVCYVFTHFAYQKHWIFDINNYEFPHIIRMGKIVILIWGVILISIIRHIIKNKSWKQIKNYNPFLLCTLGLYFLCILLFKRHYDEMLFFMVEVIGISFILASKERRKMIIQALLDAIILSFFYVMYKCLRHRPFDLERYDLVFSNSNNGGEYIACVVIAFFVKISNWWSKADIKKWIKITALVVYYILLGITLSVTMFNYTRTTIAGLGFAFILGLVMEVIGAAKKKEKKAGVFAKYGFAILSLVLTFNITYLGLRWIPAYYAANVDQPILYVGEDNNPSKVHFGDSMYSPKYTTMGSYLRTVFGKWGILIKFDDDKQSEGQTEKVEFDGRDITSGRMEIWHMFLSRYNMIGHYPFHLFNDKGEIIAHSHNSYIMVGYMLGIIAGILYIVFNVLAFLYSVIMFAREDDKDKTYFFAFLIITTCFISQVAEWISRPQYSMYLVFVFGLGLILTNKKKAKETESKEIEAVEIEESETSNL